MRTTTRTQHLKIWNKLALVMVLLLMVLSTNPTFATLLDDGVTLSGDLMLWHRVTLTFDGPPTSEDADPNPFTDYRLNVTFTQNGHSIVVPGFYADDGDAANTSATSGNKWRVHFTPDATGPWSFTASFRTGSNIAISLDPFAGESTSFDGVSGAFDIAPSDKTGDDFRAHGLLRYTGEHYLQFAGSGEYYIKNGANSPENFLAYNEFDGTYDTGGRVDNFLHAYAPHADDWQAGDPTWQGDKGKNIIGALNYLGDQGVNSLYFITYNLDGGDGADVWPWTDPTQRYRFDVSKLDQWEIVFSHMTAQGIQLHLLTQERENDEILGGSADLNDIRMLYYRELVARFSHHPALQWNIGEENDNTDAQRNAFAQYIQALDPYDHPIAVHTNYNVRAIAKTGPENTFYDGLLGSPFFQATSMQGDAIKYAEWTLDLRERSAASGQPWVIYGDEQGPRVEADMSNVDQLIRDALWGNLMNGGAGVEWYFGYQDNFGDLQQEDFRLAQELWQKSSQAVALFQTYIPFYEMEPRPDLVTGMGDRDSVLARNNELILAYFANGTSGLSPAVDLGSKSQTCDVIWRDPINGGDFLNSDVPTITGSGFVSIGQAPHDTGQPWLAIIDCVNVIDA